MQTFWKIVIAGGVIYIIYKYATSNVSFEGKDYMFIKRVPQNPKKEVVVNKVTKVGVLHEIPDKPKLEKVRRNPLDPDNRGPGVPSIPPDRPSNGSKHPHVKKKVDHFYPRISGKRIKFLNTLQVDDSYFDRSKFQPSNGPVRAVKLNRIP